MPKNEKKLLNENTIRRFMKLAEIDTLSDQFVGTLSEKYGDENLEENMPYQRDDEEEFDMDAEEAAPEDMPPEPPELDEPAAEGPVDAEAIFTDLAQALAGVAQEHGVSMDIEGGEGEEVADLGDEEDFDMAPEEGAPEEEEDEVPGVELEEEIDEDAVVAEITRRVTTRLMKESRNDKVADQLAEKIMARLKNTSSRE